MGDKHQEYDDKGRKIACKVCKCFYHRLEVHLKKVHNMTIDEYTGKYPGSPTISKAARDSVAKSTSAPPVIANLLEGNITEDIFADEEDNKNVVSTASLQFGNAILNIVDDSELTPIQRAHVPKNDENWQLGANEREALEYAAAGVLDGDNIFIWGDPGAGKTTLVKQLGALLNTPVMIFQFSNAVAMEDFFGEPRLEKDEDGATITTWAQGLFTKCWREGYFIVFDEITAASANMMLRLHGPLDGDALVLAENGGEVVPKHKRTRIFATDNTNGRGDETGLFTGTSVLNEATLDRFGTVIHYGYPDEKSEIKILVAKTGLEEEMAQKMVSVAHKIRESFRNEECTCTLSTRRLINWARKTVLLKNIRKASLLTIINKLSKNDAEFVDAIVQRFFGGSI